MPLGQSLINHIRKNFTLLSFFLEGLHYFHKKKKNKKKKNNKNKKLSTKLTILLFFQKTFLKMILKPIPLKQ